MQGLSSTLIFGMVSIVKVIMKEWDDPRIQILIATEHPVKQQQMIHLSEFSRSTPIPKTNQSARLKTTVYLMWRSPV